MTSPIYGLPELTPTTVERTNTNLVVRYLESLVGAVPTVNVSTVPSSPSDGSVYLINGVPTGIWSGKAGQVGIYTISGWFYVPTHPKYQYASGTWVSSVSGGNLSDTLILVDDFTAPDNTAIVGRTPSLPVGSNVWYKILSGAGNGSIQNNKATIAPLSFVAVATNINATSYTISADFYVPSESSSTAVNIYFRAAGVDAPFMQFQSINGVCSIQSYNHNL
jgi:hypothetical protein